MLLPALLVLLLTASSPSLLAVRGDDGHEQRSRNASSSAADGEAPEARVLQGRVRGKLMVSEGGREYYAFLGIPYAKPPVGDLRFKFPRRLAAEDAWEGVLACDKDAPKCPQLSYPEDIYEGDEDCLYLNVYTHRLQDTTIPLEELTDKLRPVLVWLHGGDFQHGSGSFDDVGPERFMDNEEDLVLVVPNFRLNALGFLSIGEHPAVGNAGLKDQFTALSWVHSNIAGFGGHPGRVTLGGSQSGGVAAHLHAISPLSSHEPNMFLQTISVSGNALAPWAVLTAREARRRALKLGRVMGCIRSGKADHQVKAAEVVRCLRTKPAEDIVRNADKVLDWYCDITFPFVPVVEVFDGHNRPFMVTHPLQMMQNMMSGLVPKTWVTGVTTHTGLPMSLQMMVYPSMLTDLNEHFEERIWDYLGLSHIAGKDVLRDAGRRLKDFYFPGNQSISQATLSGLIDLTSDALYHHSLYRSIQLQSEAKKAPALVYRFGFERHKNRDHILGVPLGADAELMFPAVFANEKSKLTESEAGISKKLLHFIRNFVSSEDPTPEKEEFLDDVEWPPAKGTNFSFIDIGLDGKFNVNNEGFYTERMAFWEKVLEQLENESHSADKSNTRNQSIKDEF